MVSSICFAVVLKDSVGSWYLCTTGGVAKRAATPGDVAVAGCADVGVAAAARAGARCAAARFAGARFAVTWICGKGGVG